MALYDYWVSQMGTEQLLPILDGSQVVGRSVLRLMIISAGDLNAPNLSTSPNELTLLNAETTASKIGTLCNALMGIEIDVLHESSCPRSYEAHSFYVAGIESAWAGQTSTNGVAALPLFYVVLRSLLSIEYDFLASPIFWKQYEEVGRVWKSRSQVTQSTID
ncbi:uncharacterized protein BCR38DRAFT_472964 [Pseudomassariella vexata]|uniref:Uncharacterized protein n=1 Tax=Pseudomassariella vexata TaxID=1141098 RepID=A0A1Y2E7T8_9PEZI|nr:uncharacterized protein BCR38DRAFT_472964 [Pseudomassariella vexata]ORY67600.1 hypothetical protein BCR38DRAFT_472964 [Pseudomassariella vexata]